MGGVNRAEIKWYLRPATVIVAILCVGPFALPLVWMSPVFKNWAKAAITAAVIILTFWLARASVEALNTLSGQMQDLQKVLR